MLTSAYINVDSGVLRQMLAAYQIKQNTAGHRTTFLGGLFTRSATDDTSLDINAGNYPLDGVDALTDCTVKGIKLSGNSLPADVTSNELDEITHIFRTAFNISVNDLAATNPTFENKKIDIAISNTYLSLTSAVTQWVKLKKLVIRYTSKTGSGSTTNYMGMSFVLHIDETYCPRQQIGNGMSNQQIFIWGKTGYGANAAARVTSQQVFQFSSSLLKSDGATSPTYTSLDCAEFDIDFIRDRYAIMNIVGHLGQIYHTATNMMLPLKLVSYMAQLKLDRLDRIFVFEY
jgi:hypothetical protein